MDPAQKRKDYTDVDIDIIVDHLILMATDLELGMCWIGAFDLTVTREILGLPDEVDPVIFTPLGYPVDILRAKQRKPLSELVGYEHW